MGRPSKYSPEVRERAVEDDRRAALDHDFFTRPQIARARVDQLFGDDALARLAERAGNQLPIGLDRARNFDKAKNLERLIKQ